MDKKTVIYRGVLFSKYEIDKKGMIWRKGSLQPLKPWDDMRGYLVVELMTDNNIAVKVKNHLASAHTWKGPQEPGMVINHINGNKHDPSESNLEYITQRENVAHAQRLIKGKEYLTKDVYDNIVADSKHMSIVDLALKYKINTWVIRDLLKEKTYNFYRNEA